MRRLYALKRFIMMWVFALMVMGAFATAHAATATVPTLVVKMADGLTADQQAAVVARNGGVETAAIPVLRMHVISIPSGDPALVLQNYQSDPQVERAELNKTRKSEGLPSDSHYSVQWALSKIGWESVFGSIVPTGSAKVAILDTGIDASHPDLHANVIDGTSILDNSSGGSDANGHGTSLAGIVAAVTNNGLGVAGLGFSGVQIMPVTVLNGSGIGQDSDIIAGVIWAADHGADVILMGFSNADFSQNLQDALDYAWAKGAVLVAATGNDGVTTPTFPAGARGVVGVSATSEDDTLAFGSNYGQDTFLAAPGTTIYTTAPGETYTYITGTSASSAMVAGAAALLKAVDPALSNGVIVGRLAKSAAAVGTAGDPANQEYFGNGRLDLAAAIASTSTESVQPAGAAPIASGGPYVGPYAAAGATITAITPTSGAAGTPVLFSGTGFNSSSKTKQVEITSVTFTYTYSDTLAKVSNQATLVAPCPVGTDGTFADCSFVVPSQPVGANVVTVKDSVGNNVATVNFTVTQKQKASVTVSITGGSSTYDGTQHAATVTTTPLNVAHSVTYKSSSPSYDSTTPPTDAGTYDVYVTITDTNYALSGGSTGILTIDKASASINVAGYTGKYDGAAHGATGSATGVNNADLSSLLSLGDTYSNVPGGDVSWSFAGNSNYKAAGGTVAVTLTPADATFSIKDYNAPYDGASHSASGTAKGVSGEDLSTLLHFVNSFKDVPGGQQQWSFDGNSNYAPKSGTAQVAITPATATVTVKEYSGKYDGTAHGATGSAKGINDEDLTPLLDLGASFTDVPGGTAQWSFAGSKNYLPAGGSAAVTIAQADAVTAVTGYTGTYDGNPHSATGTATGVKGEDLSSLLHFASSFSDAPGGSQPWTFDGNTNYAPKSGTAQVVIIPASATVSVTGYAGKYDGAPHGATGSAKGVKGEDLGSLLNLGATFTNVPGGTAKWSFAGNSNYAPASGSAEVSITRIDASVTPAAASKVYGTDDPVLTGSLAGFLSADNVTATYSRTSGEAAGGAYSIDATLTPAQVLGNYSITYKTAKFTITKANAPVSLTGLSGTYDGSPKYVTPTTNPPGMNVDITYRGSTTAPSDAGSYAVVATVNDTNYEGSATGTLLVAKARATVTLGELTQTYNGSARIVTATTEPAGKAVSITYDGASTAPTSAGTYPISATVNDTNYEGSATGTLTVAKARATVTLGALSQNYDGSAKAVTATTDPAGKALSITYNGSSTAPTNAGSYAIVATVDDRNYEGSALDTLTVAKAAATVALSGLSQTYNGSPRAVTAITNPPGVRLVITYNGSTTAPTNAGSYAVAATINDSNFEGSASGALNIAKGSATVSLSGLSQTYNGSPKAVIATTYPPGVNVDISYNGSAAAPTNVGSYAVTATITDTNYEASVISNTLNITRAAATVTLSALSQPYDGSPKTVTVTTNPAGLKVDVTYNNSAIAPSISGSYAVVATVNDTNYQGSASGSLTIAPPLPAPASITVPATNSSGTITINWQGSGYSGLSYVLEYKTSSDATWRQVYSGIYNYTSMSVANGTYSFRVKETLPGYADSPYTVSTTNCNVLLACDPPSYVNAPASSSTGSVTVNWGGGNVGGLSYTLQYSKDGGSWVTAYTGTYNYANLNLPNGNYQFRVRSAKAGYVTSGYASSGYCNVALICGAPTKVTAPATSTRNVPVSWTGGTVSGATYEVQYNNGSGWSATYSTIYSNTIVTVPTSGTYTFQVRATKPGYTNSGWTQSTPCVVSP